MRVEQAYIRKSMDAIYPMFMRRFGLKRYVDHNKPVVIFGCYTESDVRLIAAHRAPVLMAWLGGDFALFGDRTLWKRDNIQHIAIGRWLEQDLQEHGLRYKRVNLTGSPLVDILKPEPLGTAVYTYLHEKRPEYYGASLVAELQKRLEGEIEFIIHRGFTTPSAQMPDVYRKCFAGIRLVKHDGGGEAVIEMGLMGRRTVHNGDLPCSINWKTTDDIIDILREEQMCAGMIRTEMPIEVKDHIQMTDEWLDLDWWQD